MHCSPVVRVPSHAPMLPPSSRRDNGTSVFGAYLRVVPWCDGRNFLPRKGPPTIRVLVSLSEMQLRQDVCCRGRYGH